jgi:glutamate dehydrogenase/leucine dehydrogenase
MFESFAGFAGHSLVTARQDRASGLKAVIAIHNDNRGPAIGGCRILPYPTMSEAVRDVLRLSRGMTYKTAIADIPYGGGKAVIVADPRRDKDDVLLEAISSRVSEVATSLRSTQARPWTMSKSSRDGLVMPLASYLRRAMLLGPRPWECIIAC